MSPAAPTPDIDELVAFDFEVDPVLTLGELRHGPRDPTIRFESGAVWRVARTADGTATTRISRGTEGWRVMAWGPGARGSPSPLSPRLLGGEDDPVGARRWRLARLRELVARFSGLAFRAQRCGLGFAWCRPSCGQKVTARRSTACLPRHSSRRYGEPAPGPGRPDACRRRLRSPWRPCPTSQLHPAGPGAAPRGQALIRTAQRAPTGWRRHDDHGPAGAAMARLRALPGIGAWTAAETARQAHWATPTRSAWATTTSLTWCAGPWPARRVVPMTPACSSCWSRITWTAGPTGAPAWSVSGITGAQVRSAPTRAGDIDRHVSPSAKLGG